MDSVGDFNHAVSIAVYWVFESNYKKDLPLTLDLLNLVCSPPEGEGTFALFEKVYFQSYTSTTQGN